MTTRRPRKVWATRFEPNASAGGYRRHESRAEAYRYVDNDLRNWLVTGHHRHVTVYVDERDGHGLQPYEHIDLEQLAELIEVARTDR
jgi:hypothetical protein